MQRRQLLKGAALTGSGLALVGAGALKFAPRPPVSGYASFADVRAQLARWQLQGPPQMQSGWPLAQVLAHCAQSIEFSLTGFPALKPAWFRASVGPVAFSVFDVMGAMRHSLTEPIPGAPDLANTVWPDALARLEAALAAFENHTGVLMPHFAYGQLTHHDYARAHLMHFSQHMQLLQT